MTLGSDGVEQRESSEDWMKFGEELIDGVAREAADSNPEREKTPGQNCERSPAQQAMHTRYMETQDI